MQQNWMQTELFLYWNVVGIKEHVAQMHTLPVSVFCAQFTQQIQFYKKSIDVFNYNKSHLVQTTLTDFKQIE